MIAPGKVIHRVWPSHDGTFQHELVFALANHSRLELVTPGPDPIVRNCWETGTAEGDFTQLAVRHTDQRDDLVWRLVRGKLLGEVAV